MTAAIVLAVYIIAWAMATMASGISHYRGLFWCTTELFGLRLVQYSEGLVHILLLAVVVMIIPIHSMYWDYSSYKKRAGNKGDMVRPRLLMVMSSFAAIFLACSWRWVVLPLLGPLYADNGLSGAGGIPLFEGAASGLPPAKNVLWLLTWVLPALWLSLRSLLSMVDDEEIPPPGTKQMLEALGLPDDTGDTKDAKGAENGKGPGGAGGIGKSRGNK
jgi:hypothetical protein